MRAHGMRNNKPNFALRSNYTVAKRNKTRLSHVSSANGAKDIWQAVRELTSRGNQAHQVEGITAHSLNNHYATISTDSEYKASELYI